MTEAYCTVLPDFGHPPAPYVRLESYADRLGSLFVALSQHTPDGIDAINTIFDPQLTDRGAVDLYEELVLEGVSGDRKIFQEFLGHVAHSPEYAYAERIKAPELKDYSEQYVLASVQPAPTEIGTQIGLPNKIITTGPNRFNPRSPDRLSIHKIIQNPDGTEEIASEKVELGSFFYWDAEPTIEALLALGRHEDVIEVLDAYAHYTERFGGNILNWNNTSVDRTQPPMFFRMVAKTAEYMGNDILLRYLRPMILHFNFLRDGMDDANKLGEKPGSTHRRTGRLHDGESALHNFDDQHDHSRLGNPITKCRPRAEMEKQDEHDIATYELNVLRGERKLSSEERCDFCQGICAGAESGLDFTKDQADEDGRLIGHRLINPALNAMYAEGALIIANAWRVLGEQDPSQVQRATKEITHYMAECERIKQILHKYNYNETDRMFGMYDFVRGAEDINMGRRRAWSLNGVFVLSSGLTEPEIAWEVLDGIDENFLRPEGLLAASRYFESDLQWDGKASWPILVRETIKAAIRYGRFDLAEKWLTIHIDSDNMLFAAEGKLGEKNDSSKRGVAIVMGEYAEVSDLTMSHAVHLWMIRMLPLVRQAQAAQAIPLQNVTGRAGEREKVAT